MIEGRRRKRQRGSRTDSLSLTVTSFFFPFRPMMFRQSKLTRFLVSLSLSLSLFSLRTLTRILQVERARRADVLHQSR